MRLFFETHPADSAEWKKDSDEAASLPVWDLAFFESGLARPARAGNFVS
jgi:hypothetical protein